MPVMLLEPFLVLRPIKNCLTKNRVTTQNKKSLIVLLRTMSVSGGSHSWFMNTFSSMGFIMGKIILIKDLKDNVRDPLSDKKRLKTW